VASGRELEKPDRDDYGDWLKRAHGVTLAAEKMRYESAGSKALLDMRESPFWVELCSHLTDIDDAYYAKTGYKLFAATPAAELVLKPWESFLLKTYRKNVLGNEAWPEPPTKGWLLPDTWFSEVHDIVRGLLVVKYLDGVEWLIHNMRERSAASDVPLTVDMEARDEGYYAAHTYFTVNVDVPTSGWEAKATPLTAEVQVTTQLQETIRRLTHRYYEGRRVAEPSDEKWQWAYRGPEFVPNYLGHILHFVEGMIMEVRDRADQ
jgi:hypothetical protein